MSDELLCREQAEDEEHDLHQRVREPGRAGDHLAVGQLQRRERERHERQAQEQRRDEGVVRRVHGAVARQQEDDAAADERDQHRAQDLQAVHAGADQAQGAGEQPQRHRHGHHRPGQLQDEREAERRHAVAGDHHEGVVPRARRQDPVEARQPLLRPDPPVLRVIEQVVHVLDLVEAQRARPFRSQLDGEVAVSAQDGDRSGRQRVEAAVGDAARGRDPGERGVRARHRLAAGDQGEAEPRREPREILRRACLLHAGRRPGVGDPLHGGFLPGSVLEAAVRVGLWASGSVLPMPCTQRPRAPRCTTAPGCVRMADLVSAPFGLPLVATPYRIPAHDTVPVWRNW